MAVKTKKGNKSLAKRYHHSHATKDQGGGGSGIFRWRELDHDVKFYQPASGRGRINIVPYVIKSKNHPLVKKGEFEIGDMDYVMDIWTHRMVGPSESTLICLKKTFGKPCPVCEQSEALRKQGKEKEANELKSSRRVFYNVEDIKNKPGELQVFEVSHFLFEKELIDEARGDDGDEGFTEFADPDTGREIRFRVQKISRGGFEFNEYKSFSFSERDEPLDEALLDGAISFDEIMSIPTYEEAQSILFGADDDEGGDNDDDPDDDEDEKPAKKPPKPDTKPKKPARDDDDEDERPAKKPSKPACDEDDDDEDERPAKKPEKGDGKKPAGKCPYGHKWGADCDQHDDCDDCDQWDKCVNASGK